MGGRRILGAVSALALLAVLVGCSPSPGPTRLVAAAPVSNAVGSVESGGIERTYVIHVPPDASPARPLPLLVMFHGAGANAAKVEGATGFTADSNDSDFIVVYPNGTAANSVDGELAWNAGDCCGLPSSRNVDDVSFVTTMLADIEAKYPVDTDRIYLAGFSNGGMMSYRLACQLPGTFAAIAVVSGALNYRDCASDTPLPVLIVHGLADQTVPYGGGETNARTASRFGQWINSSVVYATNFWLNADSCAGAPIRSKDDVASTDVYDGCADGTMVKVVTINKGTHTWPRTRSLGVDGSALIVNFFGLE